MALKLKMWEDCVAHVDAIHRSSFSGFGLVCGKCNKLSHIRLILNSRTPPIMNSQFRW